MLLRFVLHSRNVVVSLFTKEAGNNNIVFSHLHCLNYGQRWLLVLPSNHVTVHLDDLDVIVGQPSVKMNLVSSKAEIKKSGADS